LLFLSILVRVSIGSLAVIAFLLFLLFWKVDLLESPLSRTELPLRQSPPEWLAGARSAAEHGEFSKAIQCVYWAAIVHLQSMEKLPKTAGHTPREFLRDLRTPNASEPLRTLTSSLERFWYGRIPATGDDLAASLRAMEELGCKPD
jgi:hypothetical protein